jgi:hypothetical protein
MPEIALNGEVVYREDDRRRLVGRQDLVLGREVGWEQACLPVVGMDQVGLQVEQANGFEDGSIEEDKALAIVAIVLALLTIEFRSVEIGILLNEVDGTSLPGRRLLNKRPGTILLPMGMSKETPVDSMGVSA